MGRLNSPVKDGQRYINLPPDLTAFCSATAKRDSVGSLKLLRDLRLLSVYWKAVV